MKEYKMVFLNPKIKLKRQSDLEQAQSIINQNIAEGWELQQVVSPNDVCGALVGIFYKEK